jgi:hypothetical protein
MGSSRTTPPARRSRKSRRALPGRASTAPMKRSSPLLGRGARRPLPAVTRPSWKLVGLAGIAGVAATGVVVARNRRAHRDLPPDELRARLHRRLAEVGPDPGLSAGSSGETAPQAPSR